MKVDAPEALPFLCLQRGQRLPELLTPSPAPACGEPRRIAPAGHKIWSLPPPTRGQRSRSLLSRRRSGGKRGREMDPLRPNNHFAPELRPRGGAGKGGGCAGAASFPRLAGFVNKLETCAGAGSSGGTLQPGCTGGGPLRSPGWNRGKAAEDLRAATLPLASSAPLLAGSRLT